MDRYSNVPMTNDAAQRFHFIDMNGGTASRNILHLLLNPHRMRPHSLTQCVSRKQLDD